MTSEEHVICAVLRGDQTRWPWPDDRTARAFLHAAARHGVQPLIARQVRRGALVDVPVSVEQWLSRSAVQQAAVEQRLTFEARRVLDGLSRAGVPPLLMKGAALAHTHYPHPCLRPRTDTDLLLRRADLERAAQVFEQLGYEALALTRGTLVLHQLSYGRSDRLGIRHVYDVHWKVAGPHCVSNFLRWDELDRTAIPVAPLGDHARALGDAHALLLACVHRMAHHYDNPRLIWLYDIHLLASRLGEESVRTLVHQVAEQGVRSMCVHGLELAHERFRTPLAGDLMGEMNGESRHGAGWFGHDVSKVDILASDVKALPDWRQRLRLVRQHVFPPVDYIRRRYGVSHTLVVPMLYAHRFVTGAVKWMRPAAETDPFA